MWLAIVACLFIWMYVCAVIGKAVYVCSSNVWCSSDLDSYVTPCNSNVNSKLTALEGEGQEGKQAGASVFAGTTNSCACALWSASM